MKSLDFIGHPRFGVTIDGEIWDYYANKFMNQYKTHNGYLTCCLDQKMLRIHRLVALAYIPNIDNKPEVNHIDGNKQNNNMSNLNWMTRSENQKHAFTLHKSYKDKISKQGKKHSLKTIELMSANRKGANNSNAKPVICLETNDIFSCAKEASIHMGYYPSAITNAIYHNKKIKNLTWRYYNE